ncbi:N-acetyl-alpha-D-glucosaminyl L-malate synthase BshA [Ferrimonas marina]|uniref:N-acetyl-alpha-D-glucosaminyl L-malate synthase BshA n=1 Tax=Ferrimonas marina TaxID=299255 RepID=A0A1M5YVH1_9GAMM|nr:N-acetyl-alpha-D-glucosaminyl L-malate synthase BshA [Ferrimonas marina]SHI15939.1 N-acetyl-alpha-D-glucosaminyl L-malate synthase BshA [Ferrimonas marina]
MRIGIVCHPSIGGSGLVATQLAMGLAQRGHQVHVISRERPFKLDPATPNLMFHPVDPVHYPLFSDPLYTYTLTAKILEVMTEHQLDVVHAHYSIPHSLSAILASAIAPRGIPVITTIHGTDVTVIGQDKGLYALNLHSMNQSTRLTTVSHYQRDYVLEHFPLERPLEVIHNFIDLEVFSPAHASLTLRRELAADDEKIVMHVSNFRPIKNSDAVLSAFYQLTARVKARLVLLGTGPDIDMIKMRCRDLNLLEQVTFLGDVTHVEQYLPVADCVIQPSYRESFGMVLLEAMACAVPTVSSNVDGITEVVEHGVTGFVADTDDVQALAAYMETLLSCDATARAMGQAGRERAARLFSPQRQLSAYLACYRRAIHAHHGMQSVPREQQG